MIFIFSVVVTVISLTATNFTSGLNPSMNPNLQTSVGDHPDEASMLDVQSRCFSLCEPEDLHRNDKLMKPIVTHNGIKPLNFYLYMFPPNPHFELKEVGEPAFLTPFIRDGHIAEGRDRALVRGLQWPGMTSYAGFLTINAEYDSNMYFWFFPSQSDPSNDPIILWLQGGPGATSLYGLFKENGPIMASAIDTRDSALPWEKMFRNGREYPFPEYRKTTPKATLNPYSWNRNASIIYVDNPVGAGFSFTNDPRGYPKLVNQSSEDLYEALQQFYKLFPEYSQR